MKIFEIMDGPDSPLGDWKRDYSKVEGSDNLHDLFRRIRVSRYFDPYRTFDWETDRWYVSDNFWSGFFVSKVDAAHLTFEELFHNLALARERTIQRQSMR